MNTALNKWTYMARRERWEHPTLSYKLPLGFGGLLIVLSLIAVLIGNELLIDQAGNWETQIQLNGVEADLSSLGAPIANAGSAVTMGFGLLGLLVGWAYVLSALYQERKDRSILFWLSLPLSNTETVLAKWLYGWILLPMTYFLIGWVAGGIIVLISSIGAAAMVSDTALIAEAMAIHGVGLASYAETMMVQVAWIAPFFAWSLLVSQWALRTPLLWVLGVPLVATLVENLLFDVAWLTDWFWSRANVSAEMMSSESVQSVQLGLGLIVAALMIGCTIWSRRHCFDRLP